MNGVVNYVSSCKKLLEIFNKPSKANIQHIISINTNSYDFGKQLVLFKNIDINTLNNIYNESNDLEIGVDECARGPMFGRLYTAAVVLPKIFDHSKMKDSKKNHIPFNSQIKYDKSSYDICYYIYYNDE